jgi:hypothetical protein
MHVQDKIVTQNNYDLDCLGLGLLSELFGFELEV